VGLAPAKTAGTHTVESPHLLVNMSFPRLSPLALGVLGSAVFGLAAPVRAQLTLRVSPPGGASGLNQASPFQAQPGSLTETFDSLASGGLPAAGSFAVGSFSASGAAILPADQYGGAGGAGQHVFMNGTLSVAFPASKYVGFWWSAGNSPNTISLYDSGASLLGTLTTESIVSLLGTPSSPLAVIAVDGLSFSGDQFYGNSNFNPSPNDQEPYVYVNLGLTDPSLAFTRIDFSGAGFELDNLTIAPNRYVPGPLPVLGSAAAFGWSRRLRRRLREGRGPVNHG
jgi:hypothetical protein